jgi:hypothetical protein
MAGSVSSAARQEADLRPSPIARGRQLPGTALTSRDQPQAGIRGGPLWSSGSHDALRPGHIAVEPGSGAAVGWRTRQAPRWRSGSLVAPWGS